MKNDASGENIESVTIIGGGTAGWIAAAGLARTFGSTPGGAKAITLIESEEIGIVGVGEATIPTIREILKFLRIDEQDFMRRTQATFKLAIKFQDWREKGESYWHPFGNLGPDVEGSRLYQHWIRNRNRGARAPKLADLSIAAVFAEHNKFAFGSEDSRSPLSGLKYAFHFDAGLVAAYLREHCEKQGVQRVEGRVVEVSQGESGFITAVTLVDGRRIAGDFFIDCTGFRALLIAGALKSEYEDWSQYLPCDSALAAPTPKKSPTTPYTLAEARSAGWRWRIPLQHRIGNGYVYSSRFTSDEDARKEFLTALGEEPLSEPRVLRFKAGRRKEIWRGNCLSLGLAAGFLEPLESTNIHLVTATFFEFLKHFPDKKCDERIRRDFNKLASDDLDVIRDFIILHYCMTERADTPFWRYCRDMDTPASLKARIALYREQGRLFIEPKELFSDISWISVLEGMGARALRHDPIVNYVSDSTATTVLDSVVRAIAESARSALSHDEALEAIGIPAAQQSDAGRGR